MEVICDQCGGVVSRYYNTSKDVSILKKMSKNWAYDEEHGNLCPECLKKLRKEAPQNGETEIIYRYKA